MAFCSNCGKQLVDGAKFCSSCGAAVVRSTEESTAKRKTVYEGELHKCPNCGELLDSFVTICPTCGYEIRGAKAANSVRELAAKLEQIEAQTMEMPELKQSLMRTVFGRDFHDKEAIEKAKRDFEGQKDHQKENLISNYSIPNTKEDIYEFFILAMSNIEVGGYCKDAWLSKLEQAYQKAILVFDDPVKLSNLTSLYDKITQKQKIKKLIAPILCVLGILMIIIGSFAGSASGDENSPFYVLVLLGINALVISMYIFLFKLVKGFKK